MTIKVGDRLPAGTLSEYIEVETAGCTLGPNEFKVDDLTRGKKVVLFGLPGAFTPTCSAKHVPSYLANYAELKAKGVNDILCMSVNPGWGGQTFIPSSPARLARLRELAPAPLLEVDGGIDADTVAAAAAAGAGIFVTGSAVFGAPDPAAAYLRIAEAAGIG